MARRARLDAPGVLHHVIGRGIEGSKIFRSIKDRQDFLSRVEELARKKSWVIYAWALMPNHFHLLVQTAKQPLAANMRKLMTGYVVNFNRRHRRFGHLFQNRYKSIVCEEEPYLLELTRYIHLNPLRAGMVKDLSELKKYPWTGHATLVGIERKKWQDTETILSLFSSKMPEARVEYDHFVAQGSLMGRRPDLMGGGLIRSAGGWSQVLSLRKHGKGLASDERILGSGDFIAKVVSQAEEKLRESLRLQTKKIDLQKLLFRVSRLKDIEEDSILSGARARKVVIVRRLFCQLAVKKFGLSGAEVARYLGTSTSSVTRLANSPELPEFHHPDYAI